MTPLIFIHNFTSKNASQKCSACWNRDGDYDSSEYHIIRKYHLIPKFHETFLICFLFFMKLSYICR